MWTRCSFGSSRDHSGSTTTGSIHHDVPAADESSDSFPSSLSLLWPSRCPKCHSPRAFPWTSVKPLAHNIYCHLLHHRLSSPPACLYLAPLQDRRMSAEHIGARDASSAAAVPAVAHARSSQPHGAKKMSNCFSCALDNRARRTANPPSAQRPLLTSLGAASGPEGAGTASCLQRVLESSQDGVRRTLFADGHVEVFDPQRSAQRLLGNSGRTHRLQAQDNGGSLTRSIAGGSHSLAPRSAPKHLQQMEPRQETNGALAPHSGPARALDGAAEAMPVAAPPPFLPASQRGPTEEMSTPLGLPTRQPPGVPTSDVFLTALCAEAPGASLRSPAVPLAPLPQHHQRTQILLESMNRHRTAQRVAMARRVIPHADSLLCVELPPLRTTDVHERTSQANVAAPSPGLSVKHLWLEPPHELPCGCSVYDLFLRVLDRETGSARSQLTGLDVMRFMRRTPQASRFVALFFWFAVVRCRRVWVEGVLLGRYARLKGAYQEIFRRRAQGQQQTLPPLNDLQRLVLELLVCRQLLAHAQSPRHSEDGEKIAHSRRQCAQGTGGSASPAIPQTAPADKQRAASAAHPAEDDPCTSAELALPEDEISLSSLRASGHFSCMLHYLAPAMGSDTSTTDAAGTAVLDDSALPCAADVDVLGRTCDLFQLASEEYTQLVEYEEAIYSDLAAVFGAMFLSSDDDPHAGTASAPPCGGTVAAQSELVGSHTGLQPESSPPMLDSTRDAILACFATLTAHLTYYTVLYCFPNDAHAGYFNATFRADMLRLLQYWFSGVVLTHVPVHGWPRPTKADHSQTSGVSGKSVEASGVARPSLVETAEKGTEPAPSLCHSRVEQLSAAQVAATGGGAAGTAQGPGKVTVPPVEHVNNTVEQVRRARAGFVGVQEDDADTAPCVSVQAPVLIPPSSSASRRRSSFRFMDVASLRQEQELTRHLAETAPTESPRSTKASGPDGSGLRAHSTVASRAARERHDEAVSGAGITDRYDDGSAIGALLHESCEGGLSCGHCHVPDAGVTGCGDRGSTIAVPRGQDGAAGAQSRRAAAPAPAECALPVTREGTPGTLRQGRSFFRKHVSGATVDDASRAGVSATAASVGSVESTDEDFFGNIDPNVAHAELRVAAEFSRYAHHASGLFHELKRRANGQHRQLLQTLHKQNAASNAAHVAERQSTKRHGQRDFVVRVPSSLNNRKVVQQPRKSQQGRSPRPFPVPEVSFAPHRQPFGSDLKDWAPNDNLGLSGVLRGAEPFARDLPSSLTLHRPPAESSGSAERVGRAVAGVDDSLVENACATSTMVEQTIGRAQLPAQAGDPPRARGLHPHTGRLHGGVSLLMEASSAEDASEGLVDSVQTLMGPADARLQKGGPAASIDEPAVHKTAQPGAAERVLPAPLPPFSRLSPLDSSSHVREVCRSPAAPSKSMTRVFASSRGAGDATGLARVDSFVLLDESLDLSSTVQESEPRLRNARDSRASRLGHHDSRCSSAVWERQRQRHRETLAAHSVKVAEERKRIISVVGGTVSDDLASTQDSFLGGGSAGAALSGGGRRRDMAAPRGSPAVDTRSGTLLELAEELQRHACARRPKAHAPWLTGIHAAQQSTAQRVPDDAQDELAGITSAGESPVAAAASAAGHREEASLLSTFPLVTGDEEARDFLLGALRLPVPHVPIPLIDDEARAAVAMMAPWQSRRPSHERALSRVSAANGSSRDRAPTGGVADEAVHWGTFSPSASFAPPPTGRELQLRETDGATAQHSRQAYSPTLPAHAAGSQRTLLAAHRADRNALSQAAHRVQLPKVSPFMAQYAASVLSMDLRTSVAHAAVASSATGANEAFASTSVAPIVLPRAPVVAAMEHTSVPAGLPLADADPSLPAVLPLTAAPEAARAVNPVYSADASGSSTVTGQATHCVYAGTLPGPAHTGASPTIRRSKSTARALTGAGRTANREIRLTVLPRECGTQRPLLLGPLKKEALRRQKGISEDMERIAHADALSRHQYTVAHLLSVSDMNEAQSDVALRRFQRNARKTLKLPDTVGAITPQ